MKNRAFRISAVALAALMGVAAQQASAQSLSSSVSCLRGEVPGNDYAQLAQRLSESMWDNKGGVTLSSTLGGLKLRVLDLNGNSVCEQTANNTTTCRFRVDLVNVDAFDIFIDNQDLGSKNDYQVCAF